MAVQDITRLLDPGPNHYIGSRLQQGRALLDSDFNEGRLADDQELQLAVRQIVGGKMGFFGEQGDDCDGCEPALRGKYLGGENHTVKLMLATPTSFVWAFDNAAPLYRVKLILDGGGGATVEMMTPPKDTFHEPGLNNVVEFLPWSVLLENGRRAGGKSGKGSGASVANEKTASRVGFFAEVDSPYETGSRGFHVRLDPNSLSQIGFSIGKDEAKSLTKAQLSVQTGESPSADVIALEWDPAHPHSAELNASDPSSEDLVSYVYLRVWHIKKPDEPLTIPTSSQVPLGRTGLTPTFSGSGRRGDFWRATVRTEARDEILPLALMQPGGVPPDGPREVVAPLCLVAWDSPLGGLHEVVSVQDCRPSLPVITNRGCCTYVVGTGTSGHFQSIQAALDALPAAGGHVCVLPGTYREPIRVEGRANVKLSGCGSRTLIESPAGPSTEALIELQGEPGPSSLVVENLSIRAVGRIGILAVGHGVELRDLTVEVVAGEEIDTPSAVRALQVDQFRMLGNRIRMNGGFSDHAAVYLDVLEDALLERNRVETVESPADGRVDAWGGIQVTGDSRRVEIRDNDIIGGRGHGLTLGNVRFRATDGSELGIQGAGLGQSAEQAPFALNGRIEPVDRPGPDEVVIRYYPDPHLDPDPDPLLDPTIEDLLIADNRIRDCRGSGIAALAVEVIHDDVAMSAPLCIRPTTFPVEGLVIRDNVIEHNARALPGALGRDRSRGGVILSEARRLDIVRNRIESNGSDPGSGPICGIYLAYGEDVVISKNRVVNNGPLGSRPGAPVELHGGIVLTRPAVPASMDVATQEASITRVSLRANVVECPDGPALSMVAGGECSATANYFDSRGHSVRAVPGGALTVDIVQPGRPWEAVDLPLNEPNPARWNQPAGSQDYLGGRAQDVAASGGLIFTDNQVSTLSIGSPPPSHSVPVMILSTDSVVMTANQLGADAPRGSIHAHCWVVGSTVNISRNRIAEGIEATRVSLVAMAPMLTLADDNILTHCPVVFGCANHNDALYFVERDNLHWFRLLNRRCETEFQLNLSALQTLCDLLFGLDSSTPGFTAANRGFGTIAAFRRLQP